MSPGYSEELQNALAANPDDPFSDAYYDAMYATANEYWDESDANSDLAGQWDNRGDGLQLVMLIIAHRTGICSLGFPAQGGKQLAFVICHPRRPYSCGRRNYLSGCAGSNWLDSFVCKSAPCAVPGAELPPEIWYE